MASEAVPNQLNQALQCHRTNRLAEAEDLYRQILSSDPDNADALHLLGMLRQQRGDAAEAIALLTRACELVPTSPQFRANLGAALGRLGRHDEAAEHLRRAVQIDPTYATGWENLAYALSQADRMAEAIEALHRLVDLKPADPHVRLRLAAALRQDKQNSAAEAQFRRAIELDETLAVAWHGLAFGPRNAASLNDISAIQGRSLFHDRIAVSNPA